MFNRGNDVIMDQKFAELRNEFQAKLNALDQKYQSEMDELEADLIKRMDLSDKTPKVDSLKETQQEETAAVNKGVYVPWSQRKKSRRTQNSNPEKFQRKVLPR